MKIGKREKTWKKIDATRYNRSANRNQTILKSFKPRIKIGYPNSLQIAELHEQQGEPPRRRGPPPQRRARGGGHGGSRRPPPPRARWPELDSAPPRRVRRAAREQEGVGVGRRDVERREGGRRRPGCSAEPRTRGRREREERNTVESEKDGESEMEISRRRRWGKKARGVKGRGRTRGDRKVWKLTVTRRFIIASRA